MPSLIDPSQATGVQFGRTTPLRVSDAASMVYRVPVKILTNVERGEALKVLDEEGTLLVMCSLVDNMPYVLAEAAVGHPSIHSQSCYSPCSALQILGALKTGLCALY